jgi:hypothetical protein
MHLRMTRRQASTLATRPIADADDWPKPDARGISTNLELEIAVDVARIH